MPEEESKDSNIFYDCEVLPPFMEMCETITRAKLLERRNGGHPTAREVFKYSGMGELSEIPFWYVDVLISLRKPIPSSFRDFFRGKKGQETIEALELHYQRAGKDRIGVEVEESILIEVVDQSMRGTNGQE